MVSLKSEGHSGHQCSNAVFTKRPSNSMAEFRLSLSKSTWQQGGYHLDIMQLHCLLWGLSAGRRCTG